MKIRSRKIAAVRKITSIKVMQVTLEQDFSPYAPMNAYVEMTIRIPLNSEECSTAQKLRDRMKSLYNAELLEGPHEKL